MHRLNYRGFCITVEEIRTILNGPILGYACYVKEGPCVIEIYGARLLNPEDHTNIFPTVEAAITCAQSHVDSQIPN